MCGCCRPSLAFDGTQPTCVGNARQGRSENEVAQQQSITLSSTDARWVFLVAITLDGSLLLMSQRHSVNDGQDFVNVSWCWAFRDGKNSAISGAKMLRTRCCLRWSMEA